MFYIYKLQKDIKNKIKTIIELMLFQRIQRRETVFLIR